MDIYTLIFFVLVIGTAVFFMFYSSKRLEKKLQEQTDKELQQKLFESGLESVNKNIGELRQDFAERLGRIDEAQRNIN